jgi:pimeloyl-ACP methyl ester carboxylesterase
MGKVKLQEKKHRFSRRRQIWLWIAMVIVLAGAVATYIVSHHFDKVADIIPTLPKTNRKTIGGKVISQEVIRNYSTEEVNALAKQNYGAEALPAKNPITKRLIKYTSVDTRGQQIEVYARIYLPRTVTSGKIPLISFAPGTTGVGDACAASLEQPAIANWANYESHMAAYAGQGYAVVITDYEGMRDSSRIHHYMVGELEGRAVLDAARAAYSLSDIKDLDRDQLFLAGYSQGGHAIAWADRIAGSYSPDLKVKGDINFAPVSSVETTLADITRGANIVWFGPFVLTSYSDLYGQNYNLPKILQQKWLANLKTDVTGHCINSVKYWPRADEVYTPEFLAALKTGSLSSNYPELYQDLSKNEAWTAVTGTPKLINQGDKDNIIMPDQQTKLLPSICAPGSGPTQLQKYADATHYSVMVKSYKDTLAWLTKVSTRQPLPNSCVSGQ